MIDIAQQLLDSNEQILSKSYHAEEQLFKQYVLLNMVAEEATKDEHIGFNTLFARISYLSSMYHFAKSDLYFIHTFRVSFEKKSYTEEDYHDLIQIGHTAIFNFIATIWQPHLTLKRYPDSQFEKFQNRRPKNEKYVKIIEALVVKIDYNSKELIYLDNYNHGEECIALFDIPDTNEQFTKNILAIKNVYDLPIHINFIDVSIDDKGIARPKAFVVHPDYLIDVTSIATYASQKDHDIWLYGLNKFDMKTTSKALIIGHIANYFLDSLIANPTLAFKDTFQQIFELFPIEWTLYQDNEINDIIEEIKTHFDNLQNVINVSFVEKNINPKNVYIEPTFYSRQYGIQGRLDLLHVDQDNNNIDIVELKSGKLFKPNAYGINDSHYLQTLLYDLLIDAAFGTKTNTRNYILYSKLSEHNLKFAPRLKSQQYQIYKTRNELAAIEAAMAKSPEMVGRLIDFLSLDNFPGIAGFMHTNLQTFENIYKTARPEEKAYFIHFVCFVARELSLAKTGEHGLSKSNGLAALWLETTIEKEDRFAILNHLQLKTNHADEENPLLVFNKTEYTAQLSNFRIGDIAVLYPYQANEQHVLKQQIFKCTIISIDDTEVIVRLRSPQFNQQMFIDHLHWNIEEDVLTSSFNHMYRNLFAFMSADVGHRDLLLGKTRPTNYDQTIDLEIDEDLTNEQKSIVYKAFSTKDYFLIWGPPGTGKTSKVLKNITQVLHKYTDHRIMLLAYTNRAVDEICEALTRAGFGEEVIRIGSRYSVDPRFSSMLLDNKIKDFKQRKQINTLLQSTRIFVSTIASIHGKMSIFENISFDMAIIDEASQILEPSIIGLLPKFKRFIMIGDHKQLPAVVSQHTSLTKVEDPLLHGIGIFDVSVSLFERLISNATKNNWTNAWAILSHQGRMHQDIMKVVNQHFYDDKLKVIDQVKHLKRGYPFTSPKKWMAHRLLYQDTPQDLEFNWKTNEYEAEACVQWVNVITKMLQSDGLAITQDSIGVITPYRAQIALIKSKIDPSLPVMVDTVERYQGGAKDFIILSLCTNRLSQLASLVSLSTEGVDRKLNVALTRAREQIIILGNRKILSTDTTYEAIINSCYQVPTSENE